MATDTIEKPQQVEVAQTERTRSGPTYLPNVDIVENKEELLVRADMPGVTRDSVDINFENGVLTIVGKVLPRQTPGANLLHREYGVGDFYRTFRVSEAIDASKISAEYAQGVLTLHLPKVEAARARKIEIKTQ
ncbi:MAG: Hsp20/alpha crystallin family protein [Phycisphaerae bacterium]|nr:Hsp20/alpha crystallin family protein [Phycisphaerae bacterium]